MIQYNLKCENDHSFDSWFQSADAFDKLKVAGHIECAVCGSSAVEKAIMAPRVTSSRNKAGVPAKPDEKAPVPDAEMRAALEKMKQHVETNSDYVGGDFASEARAMHLGEAPERAIYGEANVSEAKALVEDGVPVMPLPFTPTRKTN